MFPMLCGATSVLPEELVFSPSLKSFKKGKSKLTVPVKWKNKHEKRSHSELFIAISLAHTIIRMVPFPLCIMLKDGIILHWNSAFQSVFPLQKENNSILHIVAQEDSPRFLSTLSELDRSRSEASGNYCTRVKANDGSVEIMCYKWTTCIHESEDFFVLAAYELPPISRKNSYERDSQQMMHQAFRGSASHALIAKSKDAVPSMDVFLRQMETRTNQYAMMKSAMTKVEVISQTLETKRTFVRHVSHEIRTPLNVVMSGLELLRATAMALSPDALDIIADMRGACAIAIDILNDLLTYEKLDSDLLVLEKSPCDLVELLRRSHNMFHIQAKYADVNMLLEIEGAFETVIVDGDSTKLSQVFRNLISNALKFTPSGGSVTVKLSVLDAVKRVRIEVQDTGAGMSREQRERLFQEVVQFNAKELQNGQGSGLGLFLSRKIIDMHDGTIGVDMGWEGPGSKFFVELPISDQQEGNKVARKLSFIYHNGEQSLLLAMQPCRKLRLLLVDDTAMIRKFHHRMLSTFNAECDEASDGREAVAKVKDLLDARTCYDGILMDSSMPFMGGLQATKMIRELGYTGKIFGVTGNAFQSDIDEFEAHGADEVLVKPLSIDKYAYIVHTMQASEPSVWFND